MEYESCNRKEKKKNICLSHYTLQYLKKKNPEKNSLFCLQSKVNPPPKSNFKFAFIECRPLLFLSSLWVNFVKAKWIKYKTYSVSLKNSYLKVKTLFLCIRVKNEWDEYISVPFCYWSSTQRSVIPSYRLTHTWTFSAWSPLSSWVSTWNLFLQQWNISTKIWCNFISICSSKAVFIWLGCLI